MDAYFNDFCDRIFALPWLRRSVKLLTCERNTGQEAGRLPTQFNLRSNTYSITQKIGHDYGWTTGPGGTSKAKYMASLLDTFQRNGVVYAQQVVCTHLSGDKPIETRRLEIAAEFEAQLTRMECFIEPSKTAFGRDKTVWDGKHDPSGRRVSGLHDDLAMCFAMNIYIIHQMITGSIETMESSFLRSLVRGR